MTRSESPSDLFPDQLSHELREHFPIAPRAVRPKRRAAAYNVLTLISRQLDEDTLSLFLDLAVQAVEERQPALRSTGTSLNLPAFQSQWGILLHAAGVDMDQEEFQTSWHLLLALVHFMPPDEVATVLRCGRDGWKESIALAASLTDRTAATVMAYTPA
ncbi:hypothetical protein ACEZCY_35660 [Streptacidiphilus sp. N1-12]|uniref:Uncharacterized protein n=1 Tax=Streptacidiphilus alkalitolerans TaxID=3342712 RepID=A0ABV6WRV0_9ACTN